MRVGARASYDPFGQPIDPATGDIGTETSDQKVPDTLTGAADYAWVGGAKKLYEHQPIFLYPICAIFEVEKNDIITL